MVVQALRIPPSEVWEGNDGPWSSFVVRIGSPPQEVRLLPGTSQSSIWPVQFESTSKGVISGCHAGAPSDCANLRGELFDLNNSTTFESYSTDSLPLFAEQSLPDYDGVAHVGNDKISIVDGQTIPGVVVAAFDSYVPFLGVLGTSGRPDHLGSYTNNNASTLEILQNENIVAGLSYGYTAGAPYRTPVAFGSLTFGGYDAIRGNVDNVLTLPMHDPTTSDLTLVLQGITITNQTSSTNVQGLDPGIYTFVDSIVPEIWLPGAACDSFEAAFNLTWNSTYEMYLISDAQHDRLIAENASVAFTLASTTGSSANKTIITLPYASFDLEAGFPLAGITDDSKQRYFPLKRASNSSQYFLGRTLLQEAYLAVDYDRNQFAISPATFPAVQSSQNLIIVYPPSSSHHLSTGAIVGIVLGALAGVLLVAVLVSLIVYRRRRNHRYRRASQTTYTNSTGPMSTLVAADESFSEYFAPAAKPPLSPPLGSPEEPVDDEQAKAELDAQSTARGSPGERHELDDTAKRPASGRHTLSWDSAISSITERMRGRASITSEVEGSPGVVSPRPDSVGLSSVSESDAHDGLERLDRTRSHRSGKVFEMEG